MECVSQEILKKADTDCNAVIDLNEFIKYMLIHERKLYLAFTSLDKNSDGKCKLYLAFTSLNKNSDGKCKLYLAFTSLDKNSDGKLIGATQRDWIKVAWAVKSLALI
jgi:Ca2+-binding EF-hand superfamily protein